MPSFAAAFAKSAADETLSHDAFDEPAVRTRPIFGAGLLLRLVRITSAANEDRPDLGGARPGTPRPHHCEFDYDYYVALQSRRRHQPSRLHRCDKPGADR